MFFLPSPSNLHMNANPLMQRRPADVHPGRDTRADAVVAQRQADDLGLARAVRVFVSSCLACAVLDPLSPCG